MPGSQLRVKHTYCICYTWYTVLFTGYAYIAYPIYLYIQCLLTIARCVSMNDTCCVKLLAAGDAKSRADMTVRVACMAVQRTLKVRSMASSLRRSSVWMSCRIFCLAARVLLLPPLQRRLLLREAGVLIQRLPVDVPAMHDSPTSSRLLAPDRVHFGSPAY